eukprot:scaffold593_cov126-Cylindrotheca_fusiformis.AAC.1
MHILSAHDPAGRVLLLGMPIHGGHPDWRHTIQEQDKSGFAESWCYLGAWGCAPIWSSFPQTVAAIYHGAEPHAGLWCHLGAHLFGSRSLKPWLPPTMGQSLTLVSLDWPCKSSGIYQPRLPYFLTPQPLNRIRLKQTAMYMATIV